MYPKESFKCERLGKLEEIQEFRSTRKHALVGVETSKKSQVLGGYEGTLRRVVWVVQVFRLIGLRLKY